MVEDAAHTINIGSFDKPTLTKSPLVATFKYVATGKGYWTYGRMILKLEV